MPMILMYRSHPSRDGRAEKARTRMSKDHTIPANETRARRPPLFFLLVRTLHCSRMNEHCDAYDRITCHFPKPNIAFLSLLEKDLWFPLCIDLRSFSTKRFTSIGTGLFTCLH